MNWMWVNIFFIWSIIVFAGYIFSKLVDRHFKLEEKVDDKYLALARRIEELEKAEGQNSIAIDTLVEDFDTLNNHIKETEARAGKAFAGIANNMGRIGIQIQKLEKEFANSD